MSTIPRDEIYRRIDAVQKSMGAMPEPLDALIVLQNVDLYYLTGTLQQAHLLVPREGEPLLLVRKVLERARADSPLAHIRPLASLKRLPDSLTELCGPPPWRLGMELDVLPVTLFRTYGAVFGDGAEIADGSGPLLRARAVKSDWELQQFREAGALQRRLFGDLHGFLQEELTTYELQTRLSARACSLGHCGVIRMRGLNAETSIGVLVSGEDGAVPSHSMFPIGGSGPHPWVSSGGTNVPIQRDTPIIVDYLFSKSGYHSDCTRMAVRGEFPEEAAGIYARLVSLLRSLEGDLRAGAVPSAIYAAAVERAEEAGLGSGFMGAEGYQVPFVGHGVGLEVNERPVLAPRFDEPLEAGNTIAVEPKYTHPRWGVIGLENTYAVTETGNENLTPVPEGVVS